MAARMATITAIEERTPIWATIGMPAIASEQSASTTVLPANRTAAPEVATERAIDSRISMPCPSCSRWRERMKSE